MRTIRCRRCKNMFEYEGLPPSCCPDCKSQEDVKLVQIRELIKKNPGITPLEVVKHTGVTFSALMGYVESRDIELMS